MAVKLSGLNAYRWKIELYLIDHQDMTTSEVIVPNLETLVQLKGFADFPVKNIHFSGITFKYTSWLWPSKAVHVPLQAGMYLLDGYHLEIPGTPEKQKLENQAWVGRQSAAVEITYARDLVFDRCTFRHMAATGIDFIAGTSHDLVRGCSFKDIGGTAIQAGFFGNSDFESHLSYNPKDERELCQYENFENNLITEISENSIHDLEKAPYAHDPKHYLYIYFDEGSSYIRSKNNWTEVDKFSQIPRVPGMNGSTTNRRLPTALR